MFIEISHGIVKFERLRYGSRWRGEMAADTGACGHHQEKNIYVGTQC